MHIVGARGFKCEVCSSVVINKEFPEPGRIARYLDANCKGAGNCAVSGPANRCAERTALSKEFHRIIRPGFTELKIVTIQRLRQIGFIADQVNPSVVAPGGRKALLHINLPLEIIDTEG